MYIFKTTNQQGSSLAKQICDELFIKKKLFETICILNTPFRIYARQILSIGESGESLNVQNGRWV